MKKQLHFYILVSLLSLATTMTNGYGNFEATEVTISAEANGKIEYLNLEEGGCSRAKKQVALIDTTQLYLNKQIDCFNKHCRFKIEECIITINVLQEQLKTTLIEKIRVQNMFAENAATKRQLDEIDGKVNVIKPDKSVRTQMPITNDKIS
jgi:HlyD family secretion protein